MKKVYFSLVIALGLTLMGSAQTLTVVHNTENDMGAEITSALGTTDISTIKTLKVTGMADLSLEDCKVIRERFKTTLEELDLSGASFMWGIIPSEEGGTNPGAFRSMSIKKAILPDNVLSIGDRAFIYCEQLEEIEIPNSVVFIGNHTFRYCRLLSLKKLPDSLTDMNATYTFASCDSLEISSIPSGVSGVIGQSYFDGCWKNNITEIPEGVTHISTTAFRNSFVITSVTFPTTLKELGKGAFAIDPLKTQLTEVYFKGTTPPVIYEDNLPFRVIENITVHVPIGSFDDYNVAPWNQMKQIIEGNTDVITVGEQIKVNVYPNPTTGKFIIISEINLDENVEVYDVSGRFLTELAPDNIRSFDISRFSNGLYFLKVNRETIKIMKN